MSTTRTITRWLPPFLLMAVIFILSDQPNLSSGLEVWDLIGRKLLHMLEYGLLTVSWARALGWRLLPAVVVSLLYSVSDEFHQSFVEGRNGTPVDVVVDSLGIAAAFWAVKKRRREPFPRKVNSF